MSHVMVIFGNFCGDHEFVLSADNYVSDVSSLYEDYADC